jgi:hypothetical protein
VTPKICCSFVCSRNQIDLRAERIPKRGWGLWKIKIGVLTGQPEPVKGFDLTSYYVKSCTGKIVEAADNVINIISCFGDNRTARKKPEWVAVSESGKAVRANRSNRFLWDHICPSVEEYKATLFDLITETLKADVTGIHLDCIGFPRQEYCTCLRCIEGHRESNLGWSEWRAKVITDFVAEASNLVKEHGKSFSVTLLPDPCFGKERYGEDFQSLAKYVDFFLVPLYDVTYSTTYWLETFSYDFFEQLEKPLYIELYAADSGPKLKNVLAAIVAVSHYADGIFLATHDSALAKEIQDRLVNDTKFAQFLERNRCEPMIEVIRKWKEIC